MLLMTTLINHQCYQCFLDWGMSHQILPQTLKANLLNDDAVELILGFLSRKLLSITLLPRKKISRP